MSNTINKDAATTSINKVANEANSNSMSMTQKVNQAFTKVDNSRSSMALLTINGKHVIISNSTTFKRRMTIDDNEYDIAKWTAKQLIAFAEAS